MPIQHAVLSLLASGPNHGYELKTAFEAAIGPQWGGFNIGHLYQILDRLSRDAFVSSQRVPQPIKPDRVVYHITDAGRAELHRWLAEPTPRTSGFRDDFFLKIMVATRSGNPDLLTDVLSTQRGFLLRELRNLEQLRRGGAGQDLVVHLLLSAAARHVEADLAFLDDVEHTLLADGGTALHELARTGPGTNGEASGTDEPSTSGGATVTEAAATRATKSTRAAKTTRATKAAKTTAAKAAKAARTATTPKGPPRTLATEFPAPAT